MLFVITSKYLIPIVAETFSLWGNGHFVTNNNNNNVYQLTLM